MAPNPARRTLQARTRKNKETLKYDEKPLHEFGGWHEQSRINGHPL